MEATSKFWRPTNSIRYSGRQWSFVLPSRRTPPPFADPVVIFERAEPQHRRRRTASSRRASTRRRPPSSVTSCSSRTAIGATVHVRRPGRMERPCPERRRHPRHAGNRPRDPARRIYEGLAFKDASGRGQRQRPAAVRHRLIVLSELVLHHLARPDEKFSRRLEDFLRRILPRVLTRASQ